MILYDNHKRLIAISDQTLEMLGFASPQEFHKEVYDIAQLFIKKSGYIYEFRNFHWIDYILTNSTINHRALIQTKDGRVLELFVRVLQLNHLDQQRNYYLVTFELDAYNECSSPIQERQNITPPSAPTTNTPKRPQTQETSTIHITPPKDIKLPNISQIAEELNLSEDAIEDFIKEYIQQALEKFDTLKKAIKKHDTQTIFTTLHTLKGVAANLRLKPAVEILASIKKSSDLAAYIDIIQHYYSYILALAHHYNIDAPQNLTLQITKTEASQSHHQEVEQPKSTTSTLPQDLPQKAAQELGLSFEEYQNYLKELINQIKINLAYNNYNELHKLASFARNLYLQECAKYLDQVNVHQDPELVRQCIQDLEKLKGEPNPFVITLTDLQDALQLTQIDKKDFIEIIEDLIIELKSLLAIKMRREKFLKKVRQLKSVAESLRLSNLVLLFNTLISSYPPNPMLEKQLKEAIDSLESNIRSL